MSATSKILIKTEISDSSPLAVIYGKNLLANSLAEQLEDHKVRVVSLPHPGDVLSILERPGYVFFFATDTSVQTVVESQLREAFQSGLRARSRIMVLFFEKAPDLEKKVEKIANEIGVKFTIVEFQGDFSSRNILTTTTSKIIRLALSQQDYKRQVLFGGKNNQTIPAKGETTEKRLLKKDPEKVLENLLATARSQRRWAFWKSLGFSPRVVGGMLLVVMVLTLILAPIFWLGIQTAVGMGELVEAKNLVLTGGFSSAQQRVMLAKSRFSALRDFMGPIVQKTDHHKFFAFVTDYYRFLDLLDQSSGTVQEMIDLGPIIAKLPEAIMRPGKETDLKETLDELKVSLPLIDEQLGLLQAKANETLSGRSVAWLRFFGFPQAKLLTYKEMLPQAREQISRAQKILGVLPDIVAMTGEKTYLVVFQNSAELRPTGGFVGSYALVKFRAGKLFGYKVFDVYTADGQLRGQVAPPDEILHYLGQPGWFMRDANFSPDFPLTAKRLEWFLEKETNQKVDGVIGVDVGAVQKILGATGSVNLPDFSDLVGAEDFYHKTQYQAEINFFPGSTKKRDYLGAVAEAIMQKLVQEPNKSWIKLNAAIQSAFLEKNLMVYFDNQTVQAPFFDYGWSGSVRSGYCATVKANCLMVVESNFGANKANFFVQRDFSIQMTIDKAGGVDVAVTMHIENNSPSESWPGGKYKNYLRFLVPNGSKFNGLSLGDERKATESSLLTAEVIQAVPKDQFLVFKTEEQMFADMAPVTSGFTSYGVLVELPVGSRREIVFRYKPQYKMGLNGRDIGYQFGFLKQPGTGSPATDFLVEYPAFLRPETLTEITGAKKYDLRKPTGTGPLLFPQKIVYPSDIGSDRFLTVSFSK
jgi:hypothetical protein